MPIVRHATPADIPALLDLADELVAYDRTYDPSLDSRYNRSHEGMAWLTGVFTDADAAVFVSQTNPNAAPDGMLFGHVAPPPPWRETGGQLAEIEMLCVNAAQRGHGAGASLINAFAAWARKRGATRLAVRVSAPNIRSLHFYRREGFADYDIVLERPLQSLEES
jgi:GNAT superfamily N-acetyltransferase